MTGKKGRWTKGAKAARKERIRYEEKKEEKKAKAEEKLEMFTPVPSSLQNLPVDNKSLEQYYIEQGIIPEDETEKFMNYMKKPLPLSFRLSVDQRNVQEFVRVLKRDFFAKLSLLGPDGGVLQPPQCISWIPGETAWQMTFDANEAVAKNPLLDEFLRFLYQETECGNIVQQDIAGMLPSLVLDVKPNHRVLDLRASPGHRSVQMTELLHSDQTLMLPSGVVLAVETHLKRCFLLKEQVHRYFSPNFAIVNMDANNLPSLYLSEEKDPEPFLYDRIVCGFPSSGDGLFRNNLDGLRCWTGNIPISHHGHLIQMLYSGLSSLAIGGRLVFFTYSMNPIEAEAVVNAVIVQQRQTVKLEDVSAEMPDVIYEKGLQSWKVMSKGPRWFSTFEEVPEHLQKQILPSMFPPSKEEAERVGLEKCVRILPHKQDTVGLFMAVFTRTSSLYEAWQREQEEQQREYEAALKNGTHQMEEVEKQKESEDNGKEVENTDDVQKEEGKVEDGERPETSEDKATDAEDQTKKKEEETEAGKDTETEEGTTEKTGNGGNTEETRGAEEEQSEQHPGRSEGQPEQESNEAAAADASNYQWNSSAQHAEDGAAKTGHGDRKSRIEGSFVFVNDTDSIWLQLKEFYGISDEFPHSQLTCRSVSGLQQNFCFVSDTLKKLVEVNQGFYTFVTVGVKLFTHMKQPDVKCSYRLAQEGLHVLVPYMKKRIIQVSKEDFLVILSSANPSFDDLTAKAKNDMANLENGGFAFVLNLDTVKEGFGSQFVISAWKFDDKPSYRTFIPTYQRLHCLRAVDAKSTRCEKTDADQVQSAMEAIARAFSGDSKIHV